MTQIGRNARTFNRMTAAGAEIADTALKLGEMAVAAGTVIGARVVLGAQAMQDPLNTDPHEFTLMSTEKIDAFTASGTAILGEMRGIGHAVVKHAATQAAGCVKAAYEISTARNPFELLGAQRRWVLGSWARMNSHAMDLTAKSAGVSGTALDPVHITATENARRLIGLPPKRE